METFFQQVYKYSLSYTGNTLTGSDTTHYTICLQAMVIPSNHSDIKLLGNHLKETDPV